MNPNEGEPSPPQPPDPVKVGGRLSLLFIIAYLAHGLGSQFGLIAQPVQYYLKEALHMSAAQVSACLSVMMLPWVLKPFFGLLCDFVPLFGYRRKSYLILANIGTAAAFAVMCWTNTLSIIVVAFAVSALGVAASTAVTVGLAVEAGREGHQVRGYFSLQTICYYSALVAASLAGGFLCRHQAPAAALHAAAMVAILPPMLVAMMCALLVKEEKSAINLEQLRSTWQSMKAALGSGTIWLAALFIFCWDFSPSFGVPLYFHETNNLHYSQDLIGLLAAINAVGMIVGAVAYRYFLQSRSLKLQMYLSVVLGVVSTLAYLQLSTPWTAVGLELFRGLANMIAILAIYALAADVCPKGAEVSVMATLIAVRNLGLETSTFGGGLLFTRCFDNNLAPLVLVAAATTGFCALIVPFIVRRLRDER